MAKEQFRDWTPKGADIKVNYKDAHGNKNRNRKQNNPEKTMTQDEIFTIIKTNPGIRQTDISQHTDLVQSGVY